MRGPLPDPNAIRRNVPTIPTTNLPAGGFKGEAPDVPSWVALSKAGRAWWAWAWTTPQAAGWSAGDVPLVARRASFEDDLTSLDHVENLDAFDVLACDGATEVRQLIGRLAAMATGRLAIAKECRELDDRLGLSPKGMAALRWKVVADKAKPEDAAASAEAATGTEGSPSRRYGQLASVVNLEVDGKSLAEAAPKPRTPRARKG